MGPNPPHAQPSQTPTPQASIPCMLSFPDRYHAADKFVKLQLPGAKELSQETQLALFSLNKQIHEGPANVPKPWSWNAVESTKWVAWNQLGNMSAAEAMRLYVRTLDEEQPDWYAMLLAEEAKPQHQGESASPVPVYGYAQEQSWTQLPLGEQRKPCPRYEHNVGLVGSKMYTVGGNYAGRYLNDIWCFDTLNLTWQQLVPVPATRMPAKASPPGSTRSAQAPSQEQPKPQPQGQAPGSRANGSTEAPQPPLPVQPTVTPLAGHSVNVWGDKLVIVGGHVKAKDANSPLAVRVYHTSCNAWEVVQPSGTSPPPRGGHSSSLVGDKLYIFGGEDASRRALGDLHILDLSSMMWERTVCVAPGKPAKPQDMHVLKVEGTQPTPRSAHAAVVYHDRYIVMFGGGSVATCYSDVHILDTRSEGGRLRWIAANIRGPQVSPRAGHSGALVGSTWYILGGGNNVKGCTDLLALDLRGLSATPPALAAPPTLELWQLGSFPARHALSSEGVTLLGICNINKPTHGSGPDPNMGMLLAFGGYNGKYQNAINVLRVPVELPSAPQPIAPSAAKATSRDNGTPASNGNDAEAARGTAPASAQGKQPETGRTKQDANYVAPQHTSAASQGKPQQQDKAASQTKAGAAAPAPLPADELKAASEWHLAAADQTKHSTYEQLANTMAQLETAEKEKQAMRRQLAVTLAQLETAQKGMEDARAALNRESAKVLRLEAEAAENHKKLALAAEEHKELERMRRQMVEAQSKPQGVRAYFGF